MEPSHYRLRSQDISLAAGTKSLPSLRRIAPSTVPHAYGTGVPLVTYVAILSQGLINVETQEVGTGKNNPVAHGARACRRNCSARWRHHRSVRQIAPAPSWPPRPPCG